MLKPKISQAQKQPNLFSVETQKFRLLRDRSQKVYCFFVDDSEFVVQRHGREKEEKGYDLAVDAGVALERVEAFGVKDDGGFAVLGRGSDFGWFCGFFGGVRIFGF